MSSLTLIHGGVLFDTELQYQTQLYSTHSYLFNIVAKMSAVSTRMDNLLFLSGVAPNKPIQDTGSLKRDT